MSEVAVRVLAPGVSGVDPAGVGLAGGRYSAPGAAQRARKAAEPRVHRTVPALEMAPRPYETDVDDLPGEPRASAEPKRRGRPPGSGAAKGKPGPKPGAKRASRGARAERGAGATAAATAARVPSAEPSRRVAVFEAAAEHRAGLLWLVDQLRERGVIVTVTLTADVR